MRNSEPDSAEVSSTMLRAQGEQKPTMNSSDVHWDNYTPVLMEKKGKKKKKKKRRAQLPSYSSYFHSYARQLLLTGWLTMGVVMGDVHT